MGVLLQHGAAVYTPSLLASPIHEAAKKGVSMRRARANAGGVRLHGSHSVGFLPSGHTECLELLLSRGARLDVELPTTGTPLYSACVARKAECVMSLLHSGSRRTAEKLFSCEVSCYCCFSQEAAFAS